MGGAVVRRIREEHLQAIEEAVRCHPDGVTAQQVADALDDAPPRRTLQYRLKFLVDSERLSMEGSGRWARYRMPRLLTITAYAAVAEDSKTGNLVGMPLSKEGLIKSRVP